MWCGVVWCGVVWCGVVWCGVVWCGSLPLCLKVEWSPVRDLVPSLDPAGKGSSRRSTEGGLGAHAPPNLHANLTAPLCVPPQGHCCGLCPIISLCNHHCQPNCVMATIKGCLSLRTVREVQAGEPLTISYINGGGDPVLLPIFHRRVWPGHLQCTWPCWRGSGV